MGACGEVDWTGRVPLVAEIGAEGVLLNVRTAGRDMARRGPGNVGVKTRERRAPAVNVLKIVISFVEQYLEGKSVCLSVVRVFVDEEQAGRIQSSPAANPPNYTSPNATPPSPFNPHLHTYPQVQAILFSPSSHCSDHAPIPATNKS